MEVKGLNDSMKPKRGDSLVSLPVTFDYNGGREERNRYKPFYAVGASILGLAFGIGFLFNKNGNLASNLVISIIILVGTMLLVRFVILGEGKKRREYLTRKKNNYILPYNTFWGIYEIGNTYPCICRFRSGMSGTFVRLNKDVILGRDKEYEHYDAISEALNVVGANKITVRHMDYTSFVGTDDRLIHSIASLNELSNPDVKDVLTDMYTYLQRQLMSKMTSYDVYLFMWRGSDIAAWNSIQRVLRCFMNANYMSYHVLNRADIRDLARVVFNLNDFSVIDAMSGTFNVDELSVVVPIKKIGLNGEETKLNKTMEEKREEAARNEEEKRNRKNRKAKSGKLSNGNDKSKEEFDLFK